MKKTKENKGITLIALVITIIVMLILVAVTVNVTTGDTGLFSKAKEAASRTNEASANEMMYANSIESEISSIVGSGSSQPEGSGEETMSCTINLTPEAVEALGDEGRIVVFDGRYSQILFTFNSQSNTSCVIENQQDMIIKIYNLVSSITIFNESYSGSESTAFWRNISDGEVLNIGAGTPEGFFNITINSDMTIYDSEFTGFSFEDNIGTEYGSFSGRPRDKSIYICDSTTMNFTFENITGVHSVSIKDSNDQELSTQTISENGSYSIDLPNESGCTVLFY